MRLMCKVSSELEMPCGADLRPAEDGSPYADPVYCDRLVAIAGH
jgi:hypothetical protein